ncbi:malonyl-CoA decarboxylase [Ottowia testudinis]|uniref:Malonyl-CoA decarboxylase n=1 Tax=Ottowia testudinis TaxID=2816950 RepID=A0A975H2I7_9BURK|nr:malonyl-CoA decarboxylase [Ottowia testudinis]QTD44236.1 malonyl-CoA decarboxylase [Ottowia testudinis]
MNDVAKDDLEETLSRQLRNTRERLGAVLGRQGEALSPWVLRRTLRELRNVADPMVSDVEGGRRAAGVAGWYAQASPEQRRDCWLLMSEQFPPDPSAIEAARAAYEAARGTDEEARAEVRLRKAFASPRTRLLQRFAAFPEGVRFLVDLRAELLPHLKREKRLLALDAELEDLFSTWFDVGFLDLRRISWDSPASLIEKLIKYEAVHDVKGWADAKNRLDEDRRCYGFFHPRLPGEPLIFVEVALLRDMADSITPLLDEEGAADDLGKASTAIFYSISNTQTGLRGVSFGDSLIKRVVETLRQEFPQLKVFATLSPIPGLRGWLGKNAEAMLQATPARARQALARELDQGELDAPKLLKSLDGVAALDDKSPLRRWLLGTAARYLGSTLTPDGRPLDGVARFHLGNGARVERLNWLADPSAKGMKQSFGLMVNYLYDLKRLDKHRAMLAQGKVPLSGAIESLQD